MSSTVPPKTLGYCSVTMHGMSRVLAATLTKFEFAITDSHVVDQRAKTNLYVAKEKHSFADIDT